LPGLQGEGINLYPGAVIASGLSAVAGRRLWG